MNRMENDMDSRLVLYTTPVALEAKKAFEELADLAEPIKALDLLLKFNEYCCGFTSIERPGKATKSEIRRWFKNKAVHINGIAVREDDLIERLDSLVLFPKGNRKCTLV